MTLGCHMAVCADDLEHDKILSLCLAANGGGRDLNPHPVKTAKKLMGNQNTNTKGVTKTKTNCLLYHLSYRPIYVRITGSSGADV